MIPDSVPPDADPSLPAPFRLAARVADSSRFQLVVLGAIVLNAIVLGLQTYPEVERRAGAELELVNAFLLGVFVVEILIRLAAVGFDPRVFFRRGWNVFDFCVVAASFIPGVQSNSTALRLVRLLRVARLLSWMPDLRVLLDGAVRSLRPIGGLVALTVLLLYLYGMVGWAIFREQDPARWGTIGEAMLTLFTLLTLEGWNEIFADARAVSPWGVPYVLSFILIGTFLVLNLVIGVIITSMQEAHERERERLRDEADPAHTSSEARARERIAAARAALDEAERALR